jgi:hypothetical protein
MNAPQVKRMLGDLRAEVKMSDNYLDDVSFPAFSSIEELKDYALKNWFQYVECRRICSLYKRCKYIKNNERIFRKMDDVGFKSIL